ncbi:hypothetical protein CORC01_14377 [Colletotrichum orchidophilum]|uniref:Uncharacterized protein n=1 Tax=Colletotrichum orchidophilum TaxID=1209926 RepID=A0A1G4AMC4_9PEZI|nr:uncharacterized protein CORC01_14377 [Colletotrichum orchidophilum]OHE90328.1 hypothetical protein CORC01_14377 [Colletotrichum orchidophilum]
MQFSPILIALFAGIAIAGPVVIEPRQGITDNAQCILCRKDCFYGRGNNQAYKGCLNTCNRDLGCKLTP